MYIMKKYFKKITITCICLFIVCNLVYAVDKPVKKIVFVNMVADLFHAGHVAFLKQAKQYGSILIVGLHSDELATKYKRKPVCNIEERKAVVEACKYVDKVICNTPLVIDESFINKHKIDIVIHGDDFDKEKLNQFYGELISLSKFVAVPYTQGISTTEIIKRIARNTYDAIDKDLSAIIFELENL